MTARIAVLRRFQPDAVAVLVVGEAYRSRVCDLLDIAQRRQQLLVEIGALGGVGDEQSDVIDHDEPPMTMWMTIPLSLRRS